MDLLRKKILPLNISERRAQSRTLSPDSNDNFREDKILKTDFVIINQAYADFLKEFVFEKPKENEMENKNTSTIENWAELLLYSSDNDDVFRSSVQEFETSPELKSRLGSVQLMGKFFQRLSFVRRRSRRSDYGSLTSSSLSSNRESVIPEEAIPMATISDCSMASESDYKSSVRTGSSDSDSEMELLKYFTYDFFNAGHLLSEVLLAVQSSAVKEEISKANSVTAFLEDIFEVSGEKMEELISAVNGKKIVRVNLNIKVLEAEIQRPKYFIGGGNLYVKITTRETSQGFETQIERGTFSPKWNEAFLLELNSWSDVLRFELWNEFESHNLQRVFHKGKKKKLFGFLSVPIKHFQENGAEDWFPLKHPKSKVAELPTDVIRIHCEACMGDDQRNQSRRQSYSALLARVVYNHLKIDCNGEQFQRNKQHHWRGDLSHVAQATMEQYSAFLWLKDPAVHLSWWLICSTVPSVDYDYLFGQLLKVQSYMRSKSYNETDLEQLASSFCNWIKFALNKLKHLRISFSPIQCDHEDHRFFYSFVRMLVNLQSHSESNVLLRSNGGLDLVLQVEDAMKDYAEEWWSNMVENHLRGVVKPEEQLKAVARVTSNTSSFLQEIDKFYGPDLIRKANLPYFQNMFVSLTNKLKRCVCPPLMLTYTQLILRNEILQYKVESGNENEVLGTVLEELWMKLYIELDSLHRMSLTLPMEVQCESGVSGYHKWFKEALRHWVNLSKQKALVMIHKAVQLDTFEAIDEFCKFSYSPINVIAIMSEIKKWWKDLKWPEPETSLIILPEILEVICSCKTTYIDLVMKKAETIINNSSDGSFTNYKRICTALNNIERIREELPRMFETDIAAAKNYISLVENEEESLFNDHRLIIGNTIENINIEADELIETVIEKIHNDLQSMVMVGTCKLYKTLMADFLRPLFEVIHCAMNDGNLQWFIRRFWEVFVGFCKALVMESLNKQEVFFFNEIDLITDDMFNFVSPADGVGLPRMVSLSEDYLSLKKQLEFMTLSSESLISKYFSERLAEQDKENIPCTAKIVVRAYYPSSGKLTVEVLMAEDMDFNPTRGCLPLISRHKEYADSYVTAELVPRIWFQHVQKAITTIQWNSDPAVFNETFSLDIERLEDSRQDDGFILFTLSHLHRRISSTFIGEALIPLRNLTDEVQNLYLKVTKPRAEDGYQTLPVLKQRTSDRIATSFLKERSPSSYKLYNRNFS